MNKTDLIEVVAQKTGLKKKDAEASVNAAVEATIAAILKGDKVQISGLGTLSVKKKAARVGRNPKTQQVIKVPASKAVAFTVSKSLKENLNK